MARLLGVDRRGDNHVVEADSWCGDGFLFEANPLVRGLVNDRVSTLRAGDEVSATGKRATCFLYGDSNDSLRQRNSFLSSKLSVADLLHSTKKPRDI